MHTPQLQAGHRCFHSLSAAAQRPGSLGLHAQLSASKSQRRHALFHGPHRCPLVSCSAAAAPRQPSDSNPRKSAKQKQLGDDHEPALATRQGNGSPDKAHEAPGTAAAAPDAVPATAGKAQRQRKPPKSAKAEGGVSSGGDSGDHSGGGAASERHVRRGYIKAKGQRAATAPVAPAQAGEQVLGGGAVDPPVVMQQRGGQEEAPLGPVTAREAENQQQQEGKAAAKRKAKEGRPGSAAQGRKARATGATTHLQNQQAAADEFDHMLDAPFVQVLEMAEPPSLEDGWRLVLDSTATGPATGVHGMEAESGAEGGNAAAKRAAQPATKVYVLWDLDNKYPVVLDHHRVVDNLRGALKRFGKVVEIQAFGNHHTFNYVPPLWEAAQGEEDFEHPLDAGVDPDEPLRCPLCGAKQKSPEKLAKHFQQLHQREHNKRVRNNPKANKYLKSDKAQRYRAAATVALPSRKKGYDLKGILAQCGVGVTAVPMGRQSADQALERYATATLLSSGRQPGAGVPATRGAGAKAGSKVQQGKVPGSNGGKMVGGRLAEEQQDEGEEELPGPWDDVNDEAWRDLWQDDGEWGEMEEDEEEDQADWGYGSGDGRIRAEQPMSMRPPSSGLPRAASPPPALPASPKGVLALVSDDHGFESLLKLFRQQGWLTVVVSNTPFKEAHVRVAWARVVDL